MGADAAGGPAMTKAANTGEGAAPPVNLLFIHHSCGGQLLADPGPRVGGDAAAGERCIYVSHPNGGGLRAGLEAAGFRVHEASYGSVIGEDTDICHWHAKFRDQMDRILHTARQDTLLPDGQTNAVVVFKSCFPNNQFASRGEEPGDPDSCERTTANARAAYRALLPGFAQHPGILFVVVTAPAMAEPKPAGIRQRIQAVFRRAPKWADLAREFNSWLVDPAHGWLSGYAGGNVMVFHYYDILTKHGAGNWSAYPTHNGRDSHPSSEGNRQAAAAFVPFLVDAWRAFPPAERGGARP
jgi:hypothetical protein